MPHAIASWQTAAGNAAATRLVSQGARVQRMTYPAIKPLAGVKPATEARLAQIAQVAGITPGDDVAAICKKLGSYGRSNFKYDSGGEALASALSKGTFNCETLSDLFIVMVLMVRSPEDISATKVTGGEPDPLQGQPFCRRVQQPGAQRHRTPLGDVQRWPHHRQRRGHFL